jgi:hypothetical protein
MSLRTKFFEADRQAENLIRRFGERAAYQARIGRQHALYARDHKAVQYYQRVEQRIQRIEEDRRSPTCRDPQLDNIFDRVSSSQT